MKNLIDQLFERFTKIEEDQLITSSDLHLATAALLVEVAVSDSSFDDSERIQLKTLLHSQCQISMADIDTLISDAETATRAAASLFEFTHIINKHCDYQQKLSLVNNLWRIAYTDGKLDKYEEHIIRKIADLIHVSHGDFILEKIAVREDS
jgi:uncharacterized tellurite resistance protein B-like protein